MVSEKASKSILRTFVPIPIEHRIDIEPSSIHFLLAAAMLAIQSHQ
jgi:hypothetical protein